LSTRDRPLTFAAIGDRAAVFRGTAACAAVLGSREDDFRQILQLFGFFGLRSRR
jgi:hypothetical protein